MGGVLEFIKIRRKRKTCNRQDGKRGMCISIMRLQYPSIAQAVVAAPSNGVQQPQPVPVCQWTGQGLLVITLSAKARLAQGSRPIGGIPLWIFVPIADTVDRLDQFKFGSDCGNFFAQFFDMTVYGSVADNALVVVNSIH